MRFSLSVLLGCNAKKEKSVRIKCKLKRRTLLLGRLVASLRSHDVRVRPCDMGNKWRGGCSKCCQMLAIVNTAYNKIAVF
jgi:hypothetical protein